MKELKAVMPDKDESKKEFDKWEVENWCRTLTEAEEIKDSPEKMKAVRAELEKKHKAVGRAVSSMSELRERAKKYTKGGEA